MFDCVRRALPRSPTNSPYDKMRTIIPNLRKSLVFQGLILATLMPGLTLSPLGLQANPMGANVRAGLVGIQGLGTRRVDIIQSSNRAIINWQSFSIQNGEVTTFHQPSQNSVALNRVVTGNPSAIHGQLRANGSVILINPNGVVVGPGGSVDVGGLLTLSTLDTKDSDFLNGGSIRYKGSNGAGVTNYGAISSSGGDVVLLGNFLQNYGTVNAPDGNVAFGAGGDIIVDQTASGGMISVLAGGPGGATGIENVGEIAGAAAELKAHGNVYALAIKNDGLVRASGYNFSGGKLTLNAGSRGSIVNTGQLVARNQNGSGGQINVGGGNLNLAGGKVDADGEAGQVGGSVSVTGRDVMISDTTSVTAAGAVGGSVTISGASSATVNGAVNVAGDVGNGGAVDVSASQVVVGGGSSIDASGLSGGSIRIGGGMQGNDADIRNSDSTTIESGALILADGSGDNAGEVIVWSDGDTMFQGQVSAQALGSVGSGGFVEVSGVNSLAYRGRVSTAAFNGNAGVLLLDPIDVVVGSGPGATISDTDLVTAVLQNNVVIHTASSGNQPGNISILSGSNIVYDSPNSLSFFAHGDISVNGDIKNHGTTDTGGTGHITLVAGWDGTNAAVFSFDPANPGSGSSGPNVSSADVIGGVYGAWGTNEGSVLLNDAGQEPVEVGSAKGETNAFGYDIVMRAGIGNERFTQLGFRRENDLRGVALQDDGGVAAAFSGTVAGMATAITITADAPGGGTIQLMGNGTKTVAVLINDWNTANPTNTISLSSGDGNQTVANYTPITFSNTTNTATDIDFKTGVTGSINAYAVRDVLLLPGQNVSAEEGFKSNDRSYVMIGHGGQRENDDGHENRGGTDYGSDSGHISVGNGDNSGDITVEAGRLVSLVSNRAESFSRIGHGGMGHDDPDRAATVNFAASHNFDVRAYYNGEGFVNNSAPVAGQEARRSIWGDQSGDITINAGVFNMEAGKYNAAYTQVGHGGERVRGVHSGDILLTTTTGGISAHSAPDSAIGGPVNSNDWRWRQNRDQSFAQIGHGGFDADYTNEMTQPRRNGVVLATGGGGADVTINGTSVAGDGIRIDPRTGKPFGHSGNITVTSALGVEFTAGTGTDAYGMIGHGGRSTQGDHEGDVSVVAQNGDIIFDRDAFQINERGRDITNRGHRAHLQIGHGGTRYVGGSTGDVYVESSGDIEFYGGRQESYAMVGHGGRGEDGSTWNNGRQRNNQANGTHSGGITVVAGGDIIFRSGFSPRGQNFSQIGHGGWLQLADVVDPGDLANGPLVGGGAPSADQEGHNGDIIVTAGGSISFKAGADTLREGQEYFETNSYDAWSTIGHGGYLSKGDHHGKIDVTATTGDLEFEARGGWDAVTIIGANGNDAPRLNNTEDNGRVGFRNYAGIGHGGVDATHNNNSGDNWNNSGKEGTGIGVDYGNGESDITVTVGGDVIMTGAMEATAGPALPIQIFQDNGDGNPNIGAVQNTYFLMNPLFAGTAPGLTTGVVITADSVNDTGSTDFATIVGDGATDLATLIATYNANTTGSQPQLALLASSDGTQVLDAGVAIAVSPFATFSGNPAGSSQAVVLRAQNVGADVTAALTGDGVSTLAQLRDAWNTANPNNQIVLELGDDTSVIAAGEVMALGNGIDVQTTPNQQYSQHYGRLLRVQRDNGEVWTMPDAVLSAEDSYVQIGNGGRASDYRGGIDGEGHRGFITVNAGGDLLMHAGDIGPAVSVNQSVTIQVQNYKGVDGAGNTAATVGGGTFHGDGFYGVGPGIAGSAADYIRNANGNADRGQMDDQSVGQRNYVQIGTGGHASRGDHASTIIVNVLGDIELHAGEGREDYAQIGNGGYNSDGNDNDNLRADDEGNSGTVSVTAGGKVEILGGGRDGNVVGARGTDPAVMSGNDDHARASYAQIGHGGALVGGNHSGDISLRAETGIDIIAGSSPRGAYGMVGNGGYWARSEKVTGNVSVVTAAGDITLEGGKPIVDSETQLGGLDNTGHISTARENFAMIGNGGFDADAQSGSGQNNDVGSGGNSGDITVVAATGSVILRGGGDVTISANNDNYRGNYSQIGNGGSFTDGDHTGSIRVSAGSDISVTGGSGGREAFSQIGHGGYDSDGDHVGTIDLEAGRHVLLTRGDGLNNPWSKVGHGGQAFGGRNNNGAGTRAGDITISAGLDFNSTGGSVGHVDSKNDGNLFAYADGNTFIAVSRNDPFGGGAGNFITDAATVITSAGFGAGSELRIYMPDSSANMIASGTVLNNSEYTRTPAPDSGRNDEVLAVEHALTTGVDGEPVGDFTPEGPYQTNNFGLYNIYYAGDATTGPSDVPFVTGDFPAFFTSLFYDTFDRQYGLYEYDGYEGQLSSIGILDAVDSAAAEGIDEADEEKRRRRSGEGEKVGKSGVIFHVFEPGTNKYSSYAVFGYPSAFLSVTQ